VTGIEKTVGECSASGTGKFPSEWSSGFENKGEQPEGSRPCEDGVKL
jgi:hypothetical protein